MEKTVVLKTRRVDPLGYCDCSCYNFITSRNCMGSSFEREGGVVFSFSQGAELTTIYLQARRRVGEEEIITSYQLRCTVSSRNLMVVSRGFRPFLWRN